MPPARVLIADDEPLARATIRLLLEDDPRVTVVGECEDGAAAVSALCGQAPDLVFLDVQMPEMSGFDVVEAVGPEQMPIVVFVTASDRHALSAFNAHALDYLVKPFDADRFSQALERALRLIRQREVAETSRRLVALMQDPARESSPVSPVDSNEAVDRLVVRSSQALYVVPVGDVDWIEAAGDYVVLHAGGKKHLVRDTMQALEAKLDGRRFVRIHRSTIVNLARVRELRPHQHGDYDVVLTTGQTVRLSRRYREHVEQALAGRS